MRDLWRWQPGRLLRLLALCAAGWVLWWLLVRDGAWAGAKAVSGALGSAAVPVDKILTTAAVSGAPLAGMLGFCGAVSEACVLLCSTMGQYRMGFGSGQCA